MDILSFFRIKAKLYSLFVLKGFSNYVWIKITAIAILLILNFIMNFLIPSFSYYDLFKAAEPVCLVVGIYMAANTTYTVEGKEMKVWSKKFGFPQTEIEEN